MGFTHGKSPLTFFRFTTDASRNPTHNSQLTKPWASPTAIKYQPFRPFIQCSPLTAHRSPLTHPWVSPMAIHCFSSFLYTTPSFITNFTFSRTAISSIGLFSTAMISACFPTVMEPASLVMPSKSAAFIVAV